jgi:diguanylate cyclase (GGDEF)-like protein/PAS domain S-box-containing protein
MDGRGEGGLSRAAIAALDVGVVVIGADGRVLDANDAAVSIVGLPRDELIGQRVPAASRMAYWEDGTPVTPETSRGLRTLREGAPFRDAVMRLTGGGVPDQWVSATYAPLRSAGGEVDGVVMSIVDVTERRRVEAAVLEERDRARRYVDMAGTMMLALDDAGRVTLINQKAMAVLGYTEEELLGRDWIDTVIPVEERVPVRAALGQLFKDEVDPVAYYENSVVTKAGERRTIAWHNSVDRDASGAVVATLSSGDDVTDRRRDEREISHMAYHDRLTGLANRALVDQYLSRAIAAAQRSGEAVAVLFMDLDRFKMVNDSLGHAAGDRLLEMVAERLSAITRESDMLARHAGDEFLLVLTGLRGDPRADVDAVVDKLLAAVADPFTIAGAEFQIGLSIGVSVFPDDADEPEELLKNADGAMYQAKVAGRNRAAFFTPGGEDPRRRLSMTTRLRRALAEEQFVLHYQPIFNLDDGAVDSVEALLRWSDPHEGLMPPGRFIQLAEDTGLMGPIGSWVIDEVCRQAHAWKLAGLSSRVSFNLSPRQLRSGADVAARLGDGLQAGGVSPESIVVELTESAAMADEAGTRNSLQALRDLGVQLAIDDFGAGYSSLGRLRTLAVQQLKIDRAFLRDVPGDGASATIVRAVIGLARGLGMATVAEGVETAAQHEFLCAEDCPLAQGFHLARPMPADQATVLLLARLEAGQPQRPA